MADEVIVKYGTFSHVAGTVSFAIAARTIFDETGQYRRGISYVWTLNGALIGTDMADIATKRDALMAAYAIAGQDLVVEQGGTVRVQLLTASCKGGTRVMDGPTFEDSRGGTWITNLPFTVTIAGDIFDGEAADADIIFLEEDTTYAIGQDTHTTFSVAGRIRVKDGISAYAKAQARIASVYPVAAGYQRMASNYTINEEDDEAQYGFSDWEWWKELPVDTTVGGYTETRTREGRDAQRVSRRGSFTGTGAQAAADAAKITDAAYDTIRESQTVDEYTGMVSFSYDYFDRGASSSIIVYRETISVQESGTLFILRPVLNPGVVPVKQEIAEHAARITQSGRAVGTAGYPGFPSYSIDEEWLDKQASSWNKEGPKVGPDGDLTEYGISWAYVFNKPEQTTVPNPAV